MSINNRYTEFITHFQGVPIPERIGDPQNNPVQLAGYSALLHAFDLRIPLPDLLYAINGKHTHVESSRWVILPPQYRPDPTFEGHITFALRYEGVDLKVLYALFHKLDEAELTKWIKSKPTGSYTRRIWFFFEWLTGKKLPVDDVKMGNYVDAVDLDLQMATHGVKSKRHRVNNNLPGVVGFCPMVRKTEKIKQLQSLRLDQKVLDLIGELHPDLLQRAAAFLLLQDSKASFAIEGENPPARRAHLWAEALSQAGSRTLTREELVRLQAILIHDQRFVPLGIRQDEGFIGMRDRTTGYPIPDHISAKQEDLEMLLDSYFETMNLLLSSEVDSVAVAAILAFGFVFIHPFVDGNGRMHRYIVHHMLSEKGFTPKGVVFPISAVMLEQIEEYRLVLEWFSKPVLKEIEWVPAEKGNVEILNSTSHLYSYFDATKQAEYLYDCVRETVETLLPAEVLYLKRHFKMCEFLDQRFAMPEKTSELLIRFLVQNQGVLSKRALEKEFSVLEPSEIEGIEGFYKRVQEEEL